MPKVRSNGAARWASRTAAATPDYQAGVAAPRVPWQQATVAAAEAHKTATIAALNAGRFAQGVQRAGDGKWQAAAQGKGAERFGPGAAAGVNDYQSGVAKYLQVIESTQLPPRGPKGDPRNIERVRVLAAALRKAKTGFGLVEVLIAIALIGGLLCAGSLMLKVVSPVRAYGVDSDRKAALGVKPTSPVVKWVSGLVACVLCLAVCCGAAIDTVTATVTAAAAGGAAMAAVAGDSLVVRNSALDQRPKMLTNWIKSQTSGFAQVTHASGHDQVRDIRVRHVAAANLPLFAPGFAEPVQPQELLSLTLGAGAVAGDVELWCLMFYYPDLPGVAAQFIDSAGLAGRMVDLVTIEDTTTATAASTYSGARALNAASDLLKADTDYALLGAHIGALCGALTVRGVDTGNLRVPILGMAGRPDLTANWFPNLSDWFALPLIPVFNSANKAGIFIENVQDENLTAVPFSLLLGELKAG